MSDIFQEVDEEVRRERLQKLWDRYQNYVVAVVAIVAFQMTGTNIRSALNRIAGEV